MSDGWVEVTSRNQFEGQNRQRAKIEVPWPPEANPKKGAPIPRRMVEGWIDGRGRFVADLMPYNPFKLWGKFREYRLHLALSPAAARKQRPSVVFR